ncbi:hypothetical protein [Imbroritus primus]|uniref:hypothetical protein n=1 Tax=Imbroritus primus TaxID=3058603 RepID=UPI003D1606AE
MIGTRVGEVQQKRQAEGMRRTKKSIMPVFASPANHSHRLRMCFGPYFGLVFDPHVEPPHRHQPEAQGMPQSVL